MNVHHFFFLFWYEDFRTYHIPDEKQPNMLLKSSLTFCETVLCKHDSLFQINIMSCQIRTEAILTRFAKQSLWLYRWHVRTCICRIDVCAGFPVDVEGLINRSRIFHHSHNTYKSSHTYHKSHYTA